MDIYGYPWIYVGVDRHVLTSVLAWGCRLASVRPASPDPWIRVTRQEARSFESMNFVTIQWIRVT